MSDTLLKEVISVCREAGQYLVDTIHHAEPSLKGSNDLITLADKGSEDILIPKLKSLRPEASILSEEKGQCKVGSVNGCYWIIDPLDGTVNYAFHLPFYCISIALFEQHQPVLAVVHAPTLNETFTSRKGQGSSLNEKNLAPLTNKNPLLKMIATSAGMTESDFNQKKTSYHNSLLSHYNRLRLMGSQALHLCYVAAGRLDAALTNQAKLWDDAAGSLVLQEVGGVYGNFQGTPVFPLNSDSSLYRGESYASIGASNQKTYDRIVGLLDSKS